MLIIICFYLVSVVTVLAAAMVVFSRNTVHAVLWLIFVFLNVAILFVTLGAEFLAMILVIVALILIVYTALTRGEPMLYALGAMDLGLAAILWKVRKKKPD